MDLSTSFYGGRRHVILTIVTAVVLLSGEPRLFTQRSIPPDAIDVAKAKLEIYGYLQQGRYHAAADALELLRQHTQRTQTTIGLDARDVVFALSEITARYALETEDWQLALTVPDGDRGQQAAGRIWFARGLGAARLASPKSAGRDSTMDRDEYIARARDAARELDRLADDRGRQGLEEIERLGVLAAIAAAQEEREEMAVLLKHATALEDVAITPAHPSDQIVPMHELAGDLWLQVDRYSDAALEYTAALQRYPRRPRALLGLARASARRGDRTTAHRAYAEFIELWSHADPDRPELAEARAHLFPSQAVIPTPPAAR